MTAIAGHSEEVERKYYLGRVRQSDIDRITGKSNDAALQSIVDRWAILSADQEAAIMKVAESESSTR